VEFSALVERAQAIRGRYAELERERFGREWTAEELMLGLVKDVGDLAVLVQAKEGVRGAEDIDAELAHELADCLWSLLVLAERYGVDLERAFAATMDDLEARLS
jgi:NTP pyrophosphatase (non-canonical NTP hydrolase)